MNHDDVNNITRACIEELRLLPIKHKSRVVQKNLVLWDTELFPLLQDVGLPIYPFLLEKIFKPAGFDVPALEDKEAFQKASDNLCTTVNRVRKSMAKKGLIPSIRGAVSVPGVQPGQVPAVQPSTGMAVGGYSPSSASNPVGGGVSTAQAVQEPVGGSVPSAGDCSWWYSKKSSVQPVAVDSWDSEIVRLKKEKNGVVEGFNVWTGKDEFLWLQILGDIDSYNERQLSQSKKWSHSNQVPFKITIRKDEALSEVYDLLTAKLKNPIR